MLNENCFILLHTLSCPLPYILPAGPGMWSMQHYTHWICVWVYGLHVCVCVSVTYMSILVKKVQSVQIHSQDARGVDGGGAAALDVEEGGAKHGEGTDQTWGKNTTHSSQDSLNFKKSNYMTSQCGFEQLFSFNYFPTQFLSIYSAARLSQGTPGQ